MRKYLGNITIDQFRQVESDPAREKLRQEFLRHWRKQMAGIKGKGHLEDMTGRYDISQSVLDLFSSDGSPPPNISPEDFTKQFRKLAAGQRWLWAISGELERRLESLDPDRYREDKERNELREQERAQKKEKAWSDHLESQTQTLKPQVRESIRQALEIHQRPKELKRGASRDPLNSRILGTRQIEEVLRYLFSSNIKNPLYAVTDSPDVQYKTIADELEAMYVMIAEIDSKLCELNELIDAEEAYLGKDVSNRKTN